MNSFNPISLGFFIFNDIQLFCYFLQRNHSYCLSSIKNTFSLSSLSVISNYNFPNYIKQKKHYQSLSPEKRNCSDNACIKLHLLIQPQNQRIRSFHHYFRQGRMCMDGEAQVFGKCSHFNSKCCLCNQGRCLRTDDLHP